MPKQVDADAQRSEIRRAARGVFARRGVPGTGLAHVAREAGMGRSSLYHYYSDKEELLRDLVAETLAEERALFLNALHGEGSVPERIQRLIDDCVDLFGAWASLGRFFIDLRLRDVAGFQNFFREIRAEFASVLREGQTRGEVAAELDPLVAGATLIGAIDGLLIQHFIDSDAFDPEVLHRELGRIARKAITP
ncbi:MAG: TetR/AcrR family transcriptional regulator [bacterium]|nr:TetR/AcrR family transcriptional regulator [bacterium]